MVEENHGYTSVVGSSSMPYLNSLISHYGLATNSVADTHPSIGNYFMLTTGHILTNNDSETPSSFPVSVDNIAHELELVGGTWKDYREMTGTYYPRHDPLAYMTNINNANLVLFTQFATDLANGNLPDLSWIVPNGCDDAHDCALSTADSWLQINVDPLIKSALFQQDGLLIITFDESSGSGSCTDSDIQAGTWCGGQVATVIVSPLLVSAGFKSSNSYHHESVLRLMSEGLGLTTFPGFSSGAGNMSDFFAAAPAVVTLLPATLTFPNQEVGTTSAPHAVTLKNGTSSPLGIGSIAISGANSGSFAETNNCGSSLAAGASCAINVTFTPTAAGTATATLTVTDNAAASPQTALLTGAAATGMLTVSPASLSFGNQVVGFTSPPQAVTLTNPGNAPVAVSSIAVNANFAQTDNCGSSVGTGMNCTINVTFTPTAPGSQNGKVTVSDDAGNSPQTIALGGVGQDFAIAADASSVSSATVSGGQSAIYKLDIAPKEGFNQQLSFSCSGAPAASKCSISPASLSLNGTSASVVTATVTTTARSALAPSAKWVPPLGVWPHWPPAAWFLVCLAMLAWVALVRYRRTRLALGLALLSILLGTSCGGGGMTPAVTSGTPAGTYNLTVSGSFTSGSHQLLHSMTLKLTVR
ncbi:MAG: choice-of-anchor D domain-containing protein [Acidobacteriia bacterium]|nr:choice-of-anchor D domain-containing protein [Terriglobia bacterium]